MAYQGRRPSEKLGILQPQETILGLFGEYVHPQDQVWSGGLVQILADLGFSVPSSRIALNRVVARKLLRPKKIGRLVYYTMTPRIGTVHEEGRRQTFTREENPTWDKKWTLVWYSIPDEHRLQRSRLGRWLNFRGFGALQDGTWIAPGTRVTDIRTLINQLGLDEHVIVFTAEAGSNGDISAIVERAWNVPELALMYDRFVEEFAPFRTAAKLKQLDPREALLLRTRIIEMFRQTGSQDLNLPEQVLGIRWRRRDAIKTFRKVESSLLPKAAEYFRRLAKLEN